MNTLKDCVTTHLQLIFDNISIDENSYILMLIHFDKNILIYDILKWIYGLDIFEVEKWYYISFFLIFMQNQN